jgi:hypothetical protein
MLFRWWSGCGSKKSGLMNMLADAQNTLVSIINPPVLTCTSVALRLWHTLLRYTRGGPIIGVCAERREQTMRNYLCTQQSQCKCNLSNS